MSTSRRSYTVKQLENYQKNIKKNGVADAVKFYDDLYDDGDGYRYAGWAVGVARNDTVTGKAATDFMMKTARQGVSGKPPKNLSTADINSIKKGMALGYANALIANAKRTGGITNQDVSYEQTRNFHIQVFEANGLSIDNWTLETPMSIIQQLQGKAEVEKVWESIRETGGDGIDGIAVSHELYNRMDKIVSYGLPDDPAGKNRKIVEKAKEWLKQVGPPVSIKNIKNLGGAIFGASNQLGGSQQGQIIAISKAPSFNYTSHKKDSTAGYTLVQVIDNAVDTAKQTTFNGVPAYLLAQTTQPTCKGDESGVGGGVKSGTVGKEVKPTSASSTIFVEGKALVREGDTCTMNNGNTTGKYILV